MCLYKESLTHKPNFILFVACLSHTMLCRLSAILNSHRSLLMVLCGSWVYIPNPCFLEAPSQKSWAHNLTCEILTTIAKIPLLNCCKTNTYDRRPSTVANRRMFYCCPHSMLLLLNGTSSTELTTLAGKCKILIQLFLQL